MEKQRPQNFQNHARFFPPFHFFVVPVFLINLIYRLVELKNGITFDSIWWVVLSAAFVVGALSARLMALSVQDRVIRLEMQQRLERMLDADLRPRIAKFTVDQLIGLRFAGDDELAALARQCLNEKTTNRKTIKGRVKNWKPDYMRA